VVPVRCPGAAAMERRTSRVALRRRDAPRGGVGQRDPGRRARWRVHAVRGRHHRRGPAGRAQPCHHCGRQPSVMAVHSARVRRTYAGRSSPALLPRLLQLCWPAPHRLALHHTDVLRGRYHCRHRPPGFVRHHRLPGRGGWCRTRPRARGAARCPGHPGHRGVDQLGSIDRAGRAPVAAG
jgi:hypothetical protein